MKTIYLHLGGPKTGSSAIQLFLQNNVQLLASHNLVYPPFYHSYPDDSVIANGNARELTRALRLLDGQAVTELVLRCLATSDRLICSDEDLVYVPRDGWEILKSAARQLSVSIVPIIYVRNVAEYFYSALSEELKHGRVGTLDEMLGTGQLFYTHGHALRNLSMIFDSSEIVVLHYDSVKETLISSFLDSVGVSACESGGVWLPKFKVNRSLTRDEAELVSALSSTGSEGAGGLFMEAIALSLSRRLIARQTEAYTGTVAFEERLLRRLEGLYGDDVRWINSQFFGGKSVLTVYDKGGLCAKGEVDLLKEKIDAQRVALEWAFNEIVGRSSVGLGEYYQRLIGSALDLVGRSTRPECFAPESFDPFTYLVLNPDLIHAGADPYEHFISHGLQEGRRYSV
jgi:hypothetical protein